MKKLIALLAFASGSIYSYAQDGGKISGMIKDGGNQKVIDAATISLLNARDSTLVKTSVTDKEGNFSFEKAKAGTYLVRATSSGHLEVYSQPLQVAAGANVQTGVLQLEPVAKNMAAVVVTAKKQFVERKIDKTIINPEALLSNAGTNALEVLEKAPGVSVDKDGNISLKGKQGVIVMLDGKQTYMSVTELAAYLSNTSSSTIDQIEIMTNPSSKYDAAGNSGIINIKTKKNRQKGFNGSTSLSYGQGKYGKTNNSLNLNYRNGKVNLFSTFSGQYREEYQRLVIDRTYYYDNGNVSTIFAQNAYQKKYRSGGSGKLGMDFYASPKTTFGLVINTGYYPSTDRPENLSFLKNSQGMVDSIVTANGSEHGKWKNAGINLNFRRSFDSAGRELTADIDYVNYISNRDQLFDNNSYLPDWSQRTAERLTGELPSDIKIYSAKTDYTHPLKGGAKLEAGLKFSYVNTDNDARYFNEVNGEKTVDYEKTNQFVYDENINAAYININKSIKKWGFQGGLRVENTNYEGHQFGNAFKGDSAFKKSYTSAFPTAFISYQASKKHQLSFSYGRRINRPSYEDLNPFLFFMDKYTYEQGNPFLKPMFSKVFEASHSYNNWLTSTINYSRTKDLFNELFEKNGFIIVVKQGNYGYMDNASLSLNAQLKPAKWFTSMLYAEGRYQKYQAVIQGEDFTADGTNFTFNMNNQFSFKNGWGAELSGFYRSQGIEGQVLIRDRGQLSAAVSKQILKNKGSLKLSVRDLFYTMKVKGRFNIKDTEAGIASTRDSRVATLTFSYRFGKPIKGIKIRKTGGAGDEQNRVKGAN